VFAAAAGDAAMVAALANLGADVDGVNDLGVPALLLAAQAGHLPVVQALVLAGASCAAADGSYGLAWYGRTQPAVTAWVRFFAPLTRLHVAVALRQPRRVAQLLAQGHTAAAPLRCYLHCCSGTV